MSQVNLGEEREGKLTPTKMKEKLGGGMGEKKEAKLEEHSLHQTFKFEERSRFCSFRFTQR